MMACVLEHPNQLPLKIGHTLTSNENKLYTTPWGSSYAALLRICSPRL